MKKRGGEALCIEMHLICRHNLCVHVQTLGGSGGMLPQKILDFRLSETASGAFSGTLY